MNGSRVQAGVVLVLCALLGWALCGAIMGIGRMVTTIENTLAIHAVGAPVIFAVITWFYATRCGGPSPLQTALVLVGVVIGMDAFLVAPVFEKSYEMFSSLIGTWIPFALIFLSSYLTGERVQRRKQARAA